MYSGGGIYSDTNSNSNGDGTGLTSGQLALVNSISDIKEDLDNLVLGKITDDKVESGYDYAKRFADKFI